MGTCGSKSKSIKSQKTTSNIEPVFEPRPRNAYAEIASALRPDAYQSHLLDNNVSTDVKTPQEPKHSPIIQSMPHAIQAVPVVYSVPPPTVQRVYQNPHTSTQNQSVAQAPTTPRTAEARRRMIRRRRA